MNIVVTMSGRGSRFVDEGYEVPKYEISAHGRTLFEWSMLSLLNFVNHKTKFIFVTLQSNHSYDFIISKTRMLNTNNINVIELSNVTDGQATSALAAKQHWDPDEPLLVYNIDTYVNPNSIDPCLIRYGSDGWIPTFKARGNNWSYIKVSDTNWVTCVAEKSVISDNASIGMYWFKNAQVYENLYEDCFANGQNLVNSEKYISPMFNQLIKNSGLVSHSDIPARFVHVLGTPGELEVFKMHDAKYL